MCLALNCLYRQSALVRLDSDCIVGAKVALKWRLNFRHRSKSERRPTSDRLKVSRGIWLVISFFVYLPLLPVKLNQSGSRRQRLNSVWSTVDGGWSLNKQTASPFTSTKPTGCLALAIYIAMLNHIFSKTLAGDNGWQVNATIIITTRTQSRLFEPRSNHFHHQAASAS